MGMPNRPGPMLQEKQEEAEKELGIWAVTCDGDPVRHTYIQLSVPTAPPIHGCGLFFLADHTYQPVHRAHHRELPVRLPCSKHSNPCPAKIGLARQAQSDTNLKTSPIDCFSPSRVVPVLRQDPHVLPSKSTTFHEFHLPPRMLHICDASRTFLGGRDGPEEAPMEF